MDLDNPTAEELVIRAHKARPNVHYRAAVDGNSVAAYVDGRWIPVATRTILPHQPWVSMEHELLVNGKPAFDQAIYGPAPEMA